MSEVTDGTEPPMSEDRFSAYTRSASFALTLSHAQIHRVLHLDTVAMLRQEFPWFRPFPINFGSGADHAVQGSDGTARALARKGLLNVVPLDPPTDHYEIFSLSEAGVYTAQLLRVAGFTIDPKHVPCVPPHPDDRIMIHLDGRPSERPYDRRLDSPEHLWPYLSMLGKRPERDAGASGATNGEVRHG